MSPEMFHEELSVLVVVVVVRVGSITDYASDYARNLLTLISLIPFSYTTRLD